MKGYKFTDAENYTGTQYKKLRWGINITHKINGGKGDLCSDQWIHYYDNPLVAVLMAPIHYIPTEKLWECEAGGKINKTQTKSGCTKLTTIREIPIPNLTMEQRVEIGIRCAMSVYDDHDFHRWANNWISGVDRSDDPASAAAEAAAREAAYSAAWAASAAYSAAWAAERVAEWAGSAAAEAAAREAERAAAAAAREAAWAKETDKNIDLQKIIEEVTK